MRKHVKQHQLSPAIYINHTSEIITKYFPDKIGYPWLFVAIPIPNAICQLIRKVPEVVCKIVSIANRNKEKTTK